MSEVWPSLPLDEWRETYETLHLWTQMVGKTRLALAPRQNHWWHVPLYLTTRGLTTSPMPCGTRTLQVDFDFLAHRLLLATSDPAREEIALRPLAVADFYREYTACLEALGVTPRLWPVPVELEHPIPFLEDRTHTAYDAARAERFWRVLLQADRVLKRFQGRFLGKTSPVHFFWGAFDLALTRFSGRQAPPPPPSEWWVLREATSHEEISVGFWPGSGSVAEPAFYAYARPEPAGLAAVRLPQPGAWYSRELADFVLPYEAVRTAAAPDDLVLGFCQDAYAAAADLARWDRAALDRPPAEWP